jgi:hypothetical protein
MTTIAMGITTANPMQARHPTEIYWYLKINNNGIV